MVLYFGTLVVLSHFLSFALGQVVSANATCLSVYRWVGSFVSYSSIWWLNLDLLDVQSVRSEPM